MVAARGNIAVPTPLRRKQHSRLVRWLSYIPLWLVFVPLVRFLEWRGSWPRKMLGKGMKDFFLWLADVQPGAHDIVVSSYFKSGTNWMLQIATQIAWRGNAEFAHIHDLVPWPDLPTRLKTAVAYQDVDTSECPTALRVIKTHFAPGRGVPYNGSARYVCVIRDPKSVFESSYPFIRNGSMGPFLTYETMKRDLAGTIDKIAAFMGVELTAAEKQAVGDATRRYDAQGREQERRRTGARLTRAD